MLHLTEGRHRARRAVAGMAAAVLLTGVATVTAHAASPPTTLPSGTVTAVWPEATGAVRYHDPVAAAKGFGTGLLGMAAVEASEFGQGDNRSGEVSIGKPGQPLDTLVLVRQLDTDDTWWVLGSGVPTVELTEPAGYLPTVSSPLTLAGRSSAFEGTVPVELRQDGSATALVSSYVTGGAGATLEPFRSQFTFPPPTAAYGTLVFRVLDYENGGVAGGAALRVSFGPAVPATTTTTATATTAPPPAATTTTVPPAIVPVPVAPNYTG